MANAGYIGLSLQMALRTQMDVVANNVANISTSGFKAQHSLFKEQLSQAQNGETTGKSNRLSMVANYGSYRDTTDGSFINTGNPLDVALQGGDGYMVVQAADGPRYTRAGGLQLNADRQICDHNGYPIQGEGGPITIPVEDANITITPDGAVESNSGEQGQIRLVRFAKDQSLEAAGGGTYKTTDAPLPASDITVKQGGVEASNVQPIVEMTRMIELQRTYEQVQSLLDNEHTRESEAVSKIATIS